MTSETTSRELDRLATIVFHAKASMPDSISL